jgi:hypothetical protein
MRSGGFGLACSVVGGQATLHGGQELLGLIGADAGLRERFRAVFATHPGPLPAPLQEALGRASNIIGDAFAIIGADGKWWSEKGWVEDQDRAARFAQEPDPFSDVEKKITALTERGHQVYAVYLPGPRCAG